MLSRVFLGCLLCLPTAAFADERPTADERVARLVELYNDMMDAKEWDAAEALALGAQQMGLKNDTVLRLMVDNARKAKGQPAQPAVKELSSKRKSTVDDSVSIVRTYNVAKSPVWNADHTAINEKQLRRIATKGMSALELEKVKLTPFLENEAVVISANNSAHSKIIDNLYPPTQTK